MASDGLKSYPSGFLGAVNVPQSKPVDIQVRVRSFLSVDVNPTVSHHTANQDVAELWDEAVKSDLPHFNFDFCERVLAVAKRAFGTRTFSEWVATQSLSPDWSDYHSRWVDETLGYCFAQEPRELSYSNWRALLVPGGSKNPVPTPSLTVRHLMLGQSQHECRQLGSALNRTALTIEQVLTAWVQRPHGIQDLLESLNVLFGRR